MTRENIHRILGFKTTTKQYIIKIINTLHNGPMFIRHPILLIIVSG